MELLAVFIPLATLLLPLTISIVQHYASPGTSFSVRLLVILSFWLGFLGIILLPIDLSMTTTGDGYYDDASSSASSSSSSSSSNNNGRYNDDEAQQPKYQEMKNYDDDDDNYVNNNNQEGDDYDIYFQQEQEESDLNAFHDYYEEYIPPKPNDTYGPWLVTYWSTFILAWLVLPPIRKALLSGHFTPWTRIYDAISTSLKTYLLLASLLLIAILFLAIKLRSWHVIPILMALSNTYGLLLVALLLGYGLVDIPRKFWRRGSPDVELRRMQILANAVDEALFDSVWELQDCEDAIDNAVAKIYSCRGNLVAPVGSSSSNGDNGSSSAAVGVGVGGSPTVPQFMVADEEMEMDGSMTYDECVQELIRRRNLTAILSTQLQSRRTKRSSPSTTTSSPTSCGISSSTSGYYNGNRMSPIRKDGKKLYSRPSNTDDDDDDDNDRGYIKNGAEKNGEGNNNNSNNNNSSNMDSIPSIKELALLNQRLKLAQARLVSAEQNWNDIVRKSKLYSAIVHCDFSHYEPTSSSTPSSLQHNGSISSNTNNATNNEEELMNPTSTPLLTKMNVKCSKLGSSLRYIWITKLIIPISKLLAILFATLSILVLWSETTMSLPWNLSPFAWMLRALDGNSNNQDQEGDDKGLVFAVAALLPLLYMSACTYSSLFKISFFGPYCLRGYKQSHGVALIFNAQYLIRMQFPLGYNYLLLLKYDTSANCAFSRIMNDMNTVPFFGKSFSVYAPLLIIALCCFTLCDGYPRLLALLGLEHEDAILLGDLETLDGQVNEGIILLRRHAERFENNNGGESGGGRRRRRRDRNNIGGCGVVVGGGDIAMTSIRSSSSSSRTRNMTSTRTTTLEDGDGGENNDFDNSSSSPTKRDSNHWWYGVV